MEPVRQHTGRMAPLGYRDVDTDQIVPSEYCRRLGRRGFGDGLFAEWRTEPEFVLNRPEHRGATVLVARTNFGTGSSRETAVWALRDGGFSAVVAESFGDIFRRNAAKNGLLAVELPSEPVEELLDLAARDPDALITVDLEACQVWAGASTWAFPMEPRSRWSMLNGVDEIGQTLTMEGALRAYEQRRRPWLPRTGGERSR